MPHHAKASGWTSTGQRRWFTHCDQCRRWRLLGWYYEVYPPIDSKGKEAGWWWACADCLVNIVSDQLAKCREAHE